MESVELRNGNTDRGIDSEVDAELPAGTANEGEGVSLPNTGSMEGSPGAPLVPASGFDGDAFDSPPLLAEPGCKRVDFLFVIDNSFSMTVAQANLRNSFEGFLNVIRDEVDADDFHIMVVDTDAADDDDDREDDGADSCRDVLGAGRRTNGTTGADCGLPGSDRFITLEQPNLVDTFSCMATVGAFGDNDEQPIDALFAASSDAESDAGACNAGFVRRDAVLVVTLITNEDDDESADGPSAWLDSLLQLKGRDQNALVVLGLIGDSTLGGIPASLCQVASQDDSPRLREFVRGLDHGLLASVCSDDYAPFFSQAVSSIKQACTDFVPPVIQ